MQKKAGKHDLAPAKRPSARAQFPVRPPAVRFKWWILGPVGACLVALLAGFLVWYRWAQLNGERRDTESLARQAKAAWHNVLRTEAEMLRHEIHHLQAEMDLDGAFRRRDREALVAETEQVFEAMRATQGITHFYFVEPDRTCFLRVHDPPRHGDVIDRWTMRAADRTGGDAWGIELGPLGTFTLRYVRPWTADGRRLGFLELGMEVEHVARQVVDVLDCDLAIALNKQCTTRESFEAGKQALGLSGGWGDFERFVLLSRSVPRIPPEAAAHLARRDDRSRGGVFSASSGDVTWSCELVPLADAGGRHVADMVVLRDVTWLRRHYLMTFVAVCVVVVLTGGLLLAGLYRLVGTIEQKLAEAEANCHAHEQTLVASEQKYRALYDNVGVGVAMISPEMRVLAINRRMQQWFPHLDPAECPLCYHAFSHPPREGVCTYCPTIRTLQDGQTHETVTETPTPNGIRHYRIVATPLTDARGRVYAAIEMVDDITQRRRTEDALREQRRLLETIIEAIAAPVFYKDRQGVYLGCNSAFARYLGLPREEILGRTVFDVAPSDLAERYHKADEDVLRQGATQVYEGGVAGADGIRREVIFHKAPFRGEDGSVAGLVGVMIDITERKKTEVAIRQARESAEREANKLSAMIAGMEEGVVFADAENVILEVNDYFCRFMGRTRDAIVGTRLEDHHPAEVRQRIARQIEAFRDEPDCPACVLQRQMGDAEVIFRMQPVYRAARYDGVLLNVIDVTELAKARNEIAARSLALEKANQELEEATLLANEMAVQAEAANVAKSQFLANMSHEIRTPLTAILGFTDVLGESAADPDQCAAVDTIRRNGHYLLQLINDILDISKIEAGQFTLEIVPCSPAATLGDVAALLRPRAEEKGLKLHVEHVGPLPECISTDPTRLRQVLINLVGNAVKFTPSGSVRVAMQLIEDGDGGPQLAVEVVDTGIGMNEEQLAKLFQPFAQGDASTSRCYGGTGLGLHISKRLIEKLGGEIRVESRPGQGSKFAFTIPTGSLEGVAMRQGPPATSPRSEPATGAPAADLPTGCRVLLAEDGPDNQRLIAFLLKKAGAEVTIADNGRTATELVGQAEADGKPFDLVLMDMQMPGMDGYEASRVLRRRGCRLPIVALTAHAMAGDRKKCLEAGCDHYVTKPIQRARLIDVVRRHVEQHGRRAAGCEAT